MERIPLLCTSFHNLNMEETLDCIERFAQEGRKAYVVPVNVDVAIKIEEDAYLREIADHADLLLADGKPLVWISRLYKRPLKERITGSDLVPALCARCAKSGRSVFILGGKDGVAEQAKERLEAIYPGIRVAGTYAPPFGFEKSEEELARIREMISQAHPDFLIVCFGCPKQEKFIYENYRSYDAAVSICAGATVDFLAGNVKRAPKWMREYGFEWLYRFLQEPKRLFKRYFIDDMKIVRLYFKYR